MVVWRKNCIVIHDHQRLAMHFRLPLLIAIFSLGSSRLTAQEMPTQRVAREPVLWGNYNMEYYLPSGSFFFGEVSLRRSLQSGLPTALGLNRAHIMVGYEQRLTDHWHLGASGRVVTEGNLAQLYNRAYLNHSGSIGRIEFLKQISVEQINNLKAQTGSEGRFGVLVALAKNIPLANGRTFRPVFSYELFSLFAISNRFFFNDNKRRIDKTRLKLEGAYWFTERFSLALFMIHETDYFFAVAQFDQNGQQLNPDRRLNLLSPTVGVRAHFWLKHQDLPPSRRLRSLPY
jgi:hypothetical protein